MLRCAFFSSRVSAHISGSLLPVTVFDKHSLRVLFTFSRDCPPSRPDVLVVIISMLSSAPIPVTNIRFQAAVPKVGLRHLSVGNHVVSRKALLAHIIANMIFVWMCSGDESEAAASL